MQVALLVPEIEWKSLLSTVSQLKAAHEAAQAAAPDPGEILTVPQAATLLGLTPEAVRRARREGRLQGIRRNEKEWGFYRSVLEKFPRRHHRPTR